MTCSVPLLRRKIPSAPCTPDPALSLVLLELTVSGGHTPKHAALLHNRLCVVSGLSVYNVRPRELTTIRSASFELTAEPTVGAPPAASAIAVSDAASAKLAALTAIIRREGRRRGELAICVSFEPFIECPFVTVFDHIDAPPRENLPWTACRPASGACSKWAPHRTKMLDARLPHRTLRLSVRANRLRDAPSRHNPSMVTGTSLSHVFPLGSRLNERGRVELGGCDTIELAREFGTPAYVVAEDDLRARARAFVQAGRDAGHEDFHVVFASKAFPCTAVLALFAEEGLWCDVASGGELHLALHAGFAPERILMHGNAKSVAELRMALQHRVGLIVIDNFDEIARLEGLLNSSFRPAHVPAGPTVHARSGTSAHAPMSSPEGETDIQPVLIRVTPDVRGDTHEKISTGQANSKFGFSMVDVPAAIERVRGVAGLSLQGVHAHIGSQLMELDPFRRAVAALAQIGERMGGFSTFNLGGGLGVAYTADQRPPEIDEWVGALLGSARDAGIDARARLLVEPGRALTANAGVTLYTVESVKHNVSTWVALDGGMSDNLRPMLYGATYEAHVADRPCAAGEGGVGATGGGATGAAATRCVLAGKHCESGDVIVRDAALDDPRPGDVIVTPATGAYGFAMASNYNGVPRPPVVFCKDGDARMVVRRERFEDLTARDVR